MCKKALSLPASPAIEHTYTVLDSIQDLTSTMQHLVTDKITSMALLILPLYFDSSANPQTAEPQYIQQSIAYHLDPLCRLVRKTDRVFVYETTFYFLLSGADLQGATIVQERLWEALLWQIHHAPETGILRPRAIAIGHSAYPQTSTEVQTCILAARETRVLFEVQAAQPEISQEEELLEQARKLGIPYLSPLPHKLPERLLQIVPPELAQELQCYPLGRERDTLTVAMTDPRDHQVLMRLQQATGLNIFPILASSQELQTALELLV
ncbi:hypothetical protein KDA_27280 [Dictyobacter alpinus]|uniref:Type II secretion system protein GspE N-terminal domain-containing protein n=1 Tax=Dictyobacter alpinus TaxID=2014873 RepID=A0A402B7B0_9CHLR|nr:hypothetical protein [Dictyobacter alpinus]GCE27244.1 hypothetical protein KDA_27280 [Dictyobacter alpinus]